MANETTRLRFAKGNKWSVLKTVWNEVHQLFAFSSSIESGMLHVVNTPPVESNFQGDWSALCPFCGRPHKDHIDSSLGIPDYVHRMPCTQEKEVLLNEQRRFVRNGRWMVNIWRCVQLLFLVAIPFVIEALGFANPVIGIVLFVVVILKAIWLALEITGCTEKWFPSIAEKKRIEREKSFWHKQFQKHPNKFRQLLLELRDADTMKKSPE